MEIKGTSVRGTYEFVQKHFPNHFKEWLNALPDNSRKIMEGLILSNHWYPIEDGLIIPIETISRLFYNNDFGYTAFFMGKYHAEITLTGIYKFFVKLNSPYYIVDKGVDVLNTYFRPFSIEVEARNNNSAIIKIVEYEKPHIIIEASIEGWGKRAVEISGGKNVQSEITKSLTRKDPFTEIVFYWN